MSVEIAKATFLRVFPRGFSDPEYFKGERKHKLAAHELWRQLLNEETFNDLLEEEQFQEICRRASQVEGKTRNMLHRVEKLALRDVAKTELSAKLFANGLYDLIYGEDDFQKRFEEFSLDLLSVHTEQTSAAKWTIATIFPFLAHPKMYVFLKPEVTQAAAERRRFSLNYKAELNWLTYSCVLRLADVLTEEVADLNPSDMIDIQSYIWVTEFKNY